MVINLFETVSKELLDKNIRKSGLDYAFGKDGSIDFSSIKKKSFSNNQIASVIDHTVLKANANSEEVEKLCREAMEFNFASVCVNPSYVPLCVKLMSGSKVKVCTVIGFPLGANDTVVKKIETEQAINNGAEEIDMVINIGRLKDGDFDYVYRDISEVVASAKLESKLVKVIIETCYLSDEEKIQASLLTLKSGADFIKTSTGFGTSGAKAVDIALMKYLSAGRMKVKASGGIRTREDAEIMMSCGAERLGTSSGVNILQG